MVSAPHLQWAFFGLLLAAGTASAQTSAPLLPPPDTWTHGTTLNVFAGGATGGHDRAGAAGGAFGWELTPRVGLEGGGTWFDWGPGARASAAAITTQVAVITARPAVPFLSAGVGLYHATFNRTDAAMPSFYRRRMATMMNQPSSTTTFTDPSVAGGGGITLFLNRHWTLRPEVMATVVLRDSRSFVVTTGALRLGYHFEDHPITPRAHTGVR
jgi:hypothetical protein